MQLGKERVELVKLSGLRTHLTQAVMPVNCAKVPWLPGKRNNLSDNSCTVQLRTWQAAGLSNLVDEGADRAIQARALSGCEKATQNNSRKLLFVRALVKVPLQRKRFQSTETIWNLLTCRTDCRSKHQRLRTCQPDR